MTFKEQLLQLIQSMPDDETEATTAADTEATEETAGEAKSEPNTNAPAEETQIEPSTVEQTEVSAPPVDDTDITVITSEDMLGESIDMRLASFYAKQEELENTVKILLQEVNTLKGHFKVIETAIDTAAETSPTVESIENLINQL